MTRTLFARARRRTSDPPESTMPYGVIVTAVLFAVAVIVFFTFRTGSQYSLLGEQTIGRSSLLIANEAVTRIEREIIRGENAVFERTRPEQPTALVKGWLPHAEALSPSVDGVLIRDVQTGEVLTIVRPRSTLPIQELLRRAVRQPTDKSSKLLHTHVGSTVQTPGYLLGQKTITHGDAQVDVFIYHREKTIRSTWFDELFSSKEAGHVYNVLDDHNRKILGEDLANTGDYLVARRFPSTLYRWRLQVAPQKAELLEERQSRRRTLELLMVVLSLSVLVLGVVLLLFASEKQRRLNALRSEFIANVSHELKTPLSVIRMYAEMLLTGRVQPREKQKHYLRTIGHESERLTSLIENVLDFSAMERGKRSYKKTLQPIRAVVERATDALQNRVDVSPTVRVHVNPEHLRVPIDEEAVLLALVNMLDNAVKHGGATEITIRVFQEGHHAHLTVTDDGQGIADEDRDRVFERFYRANPNSRGSGIGLSLVQEIATAHHGSAWLQTPDQPGVTVGLSLSLRQDRDT